MRVAQRLFDSIGVAPDLASRIALALREAEPSAGSSTGNSPKTSAPQRSEGTPLMPQTLRQLAWFGVDAASIERMSPFVTLLPVARSTVNLNTAPREVLAAVFEGLDLAGAERLRLGAPYKTVDDTLPLLGIRLLTDVSRRRVGVRSEFFEVRGKLRLEDRVLEELSLVQRAGLNVSTVQRERSASRDFGG